MKTLQVLITICLATLFCTTVIAAEPENLGLLEQRLIKYHDSGAYAKQVAAQLDNAKAYLRDRVFTNNRLMNPEKIAIVLDIDETSLSNYNDLRRLNFGGSDKEVLAAEEAATDPAIKPTLELFNYAKANKVAVFFVTGRFESERAATVKNLQAAGYRNWDGLVMKPDNYAEKSVVPYKSAARRHIIDQGYDVILNVGDQNSDLAGGFTDKNIKLPDPFYYIG